MNFLGIGPGEFFFVIVLALIVLGPERLPGFARSLGKTIIRLRNWTNASPDAKVLLQLQQELQSEIDDIRATLREVSDSVRNDMTAAQNDIMRATNAANTTLSDASAATNVALNDATRTIGAPSVQTVATNTLPPVVSATPAGEASPPASNDAQVEQPAATPVARANKPNWMATPAPAATAPAIEPEGTNAAVVPAPQTAPSTRNPTLPVEADAPQPDFSTDSGLYAEIRSLRSEINRLKQSHAPTGDADDVRLLRADVAQLTRDLQELRSKGTTPAPATVVNSDTIMLLRIELGELTNRIDAIHAELKKNIAKGEHTA